jgi:predicted amidohydrolase
MRIACAQYAIRDGDPDINRERSVARILDAAEGGADLVVLPELANSGCDFSSREHAWSLAEGVTESSSLRAWREAAQETGIFVVGGLLEKEDDSLYNSAVVVAPTNLLARYRKTHLWNKEKLFYEAGRDLPVFETPLGNIGVLVCYDAWFPEAARTLALSGADLICLPANAPHDWVPESQRRGDLTMLNAHAISHANANRLFVACANRVGGDYLGRSCIVDATGGVLAFGSAEEEELVCADVDVERSRREKHLTKLSHAFGDRTPDVYGGLSSEEADKLTS